MKRQLLILLCIISLLCACSNQENKKKEVIDPLNELNTQKADSIEKVAELSTEKISELPLNYRFGMSESEFYKHTKKLIDEKILLKSDDDYLYSFKTNKGVDVKTELRFWFYEDKLYNLSFEHKLEYYKREDSISQAALEEYFYSKINSTYQKISYYDEPESFGCKIIFNEWFKGNQMIRSRKYSTQMLAAEISYINAPINKIVFNAELDKLNDESRARSRMKEAGIENSTYDGSVSKVEAYLKSNLKDVSSYQSVEWSNVTPTDNGYMVRHKYRAKNSFGAYELVNQVFYLNGNGEVVGVSDYK